MPNHPKTRERWLLEAVERFRTEVFEPKGHVLPNNIRVTTGFPSVRALSAKRGRIGECWSPDSSTDTHCEILISPRIADDPPMMLATLAHELIHAMGIYNHGKDFAKVARSIGLTGRMTATKAGTELQTWCESTAEALGGWPGAGLKASRSANGPKKQPTRMLKLACPECGYTVRTTLKWIDVGLPTCPCGAVMEQSA